MIRIYGGQIRFVWQTLLQDQIRRDAKKAGEEGIKRMILRNLNNTTVTIVLIGTSTWQRPWVRYEIAQSIARKNGLLGIYIHHLEDQWKGISNCGLKPVVPWNIEFPTYDWDYDLGRFRGEIEAAGRRADASRLYDRT